MSSSLLNTFLSGIQSYLRLFRAGWGQHKQQVVSLMRDENRTGDMTFLFIFCLFSMKPPQHLLPSAINILLLVPSASVMEPPVSFCRSNFLLYLALLALGSGFLDDWESSIGNRACQREKLLISWSNQCMRRKTEKETCRYSIHDSTSSFFQWSQHNICFLQWSAFIQQSCRLMSGPSVSICSSNCCSVGTSWPLVASWMIEKEIKEQKAPWTITVVSMIPPAPFATFISDTFWMRSSCISEKHV